MKKIPKRRVKKTKFLSLADRLHSDFKPLPAPDLTRDGCNLVPEGLPKGTILIDIDNLCEAGKRKLCLKGGDKGRDCDYVLLVDLNRSGLLGVGLIEKKRNKGNVEHAVSQLEAGSELAEQIAPPCGACCFRAVILHGSGGGFSSTELKVLADRRIVFRGQSQPIQKKLCSVAIGNIFA